jgi:hypothetical protein
LIDVASRGEDEVHIIWDGAPTVERNHIYSQDGGSTWSKPVITFPQITAVGRAGWNPMAFDGEGTLHAASLGGPLHASWTPEGWSSAVDIAQVAYDGSGEWLKLAVGLGNQLHVVWVDKDKLPNTVWYVGGVTSAPATAPEELPSYQPTVTPASPAATAPPAATVAPPVRVEPLESSEPEATSSPAITLGISLAPAALVVGIVIVVSLRRRRASGGR